MPADLLGMLIGASSWIGPVLIAVTLHEAAHGWVAWKLGDDTERFWDGSVSTRCAMWIRLGPWFCRDCFW